MPAWPAGPGVGPAAKRVGREVTVNCQVHTAHPFAGRHCPAALLTSYDELPGDVVVGIKSQQQGYWLGSAPTFHTPTNESLHVGGGYALQPTITVTRLHTT